MLRFVQVRLLHLASPLWILDVDSASALRRRVTSCTPRFCAECLREGEETAPPGWEAVGRLIQCLLVQLVFKVTPTAVSGIPVTRIQVYISEKLLEKSVCRHPLAEWQ